MKTGATFIVCPFFVESGDKEISCESIVKRSKRTKLCFHQPPDKIKHANEYCKSMEKYQQCPYYRALMSVKYKEYL